MLQFITWYIGYEVYIRIKMKIIRQRKEHQCGFNRCASGKLLPEKTIVVMELFRKEKGWSTAYFHPDCYFQWIREYVSTKVKDLEAKIEARIKVKREKKESEPKNKVGRPQKTNNPQEYRRLKALLWYHKKAGNGDRTKAVGIQLKELENNDSMGHEPTSGV